MKDTLISNTEKILSYIASLNNDLRHLCNSEITIVGDFLIEIYSFGKYYSDTIELVVDRECIDYLKEIIRQDCSISTFKGYRLTNIDISRTIKLTFVSIKNYDLIPIEINGFTINALSPEDLIIFYLERYKTTNNEEYIIKSYDALLILRHWIDINILIDKSIKHGLLKEVMFLIKILSSSSYLN